MKRLSILIFNTLILCSLSAVETIVLNPSMVSPDSNENRVRLTYILDRASIAASRQYDNYISVQMKGNSPVRGDYEVSITAVMDGETPVISLTISRRGQSQGLNLALTGEIDDETPLYLSQLLFKLWTQMNPEKILVDAPLPQFLEEVPSSTIIEAAISDFSGYSTASALALRENGNIVAAMGSLCYELDSDFNIIRPIGDDLFTPNSGVFLFGAAVTPGGTTFLKPVNGREIFKVIEGSGRTLKLRTGIDVSGPMAVLPDGTAIVHHLTSRKFVRLDNNGKSNLELDVAPYTAVSAMTAGPEGYLWLYDNMEQRFKSFSGDGTLISSLIVTGTGQDSLYPMSLVVLSDGTILFYSSGALYKVNREGILLWKMTGYHFRGDETFPLTPINIGVDENRGFIYLADYASNRILKFFDPQMAGGSTDEETQFLLELNGKISNNSHSSKILAEKAEYYLNKGSYVLARLWYEELLNVDPFNSEAEEALAAIEINSLAKQAETLEEKTLTTAREIGPESAREDFSRTIRLYERILSLDPEDDSLRNRMNRFRETYNRELSGTDGEKAPLEIIAFSIDGIFPSLIHYYRDNPVGSVTIKNISDQPVSGITASVVLKQYIDFPVETKADRTLAPGEEMTIELSILLNDRAFQLREDLPLPAQAKVSYNISGTSGEVTITSAATMFRRTALTWDDTAKLASFIMPREKIVSSFAHRVLTGKEPAPGIPDKMNSAARICDALGTYDITYTEDPQSPLSQIMDKKQHVDTVRYPRTTLSIGSGDCDDSTALLASLFEAAGIKTAIMTSPGHVFLAFDTEEPAESKWLFEGYEQQILTHGGSLWIPVETTVLQNGFHEAWKNASRIISRHAPEEIEFVEVAASRETYPPLPLPDSTLIVVEPGSDQIDEIYEKTVESLENSLFEDKLVELKEQIMGSSDNLRKRLLNRMAILHARFEEYEDAEELLHDLIEEYPGFLPPFLNLGNLYYKTGQYGKAKEILERAYENKPESVAVNLALARTSYRLGDRRATEKYFSLIESKSHELSRRYAYLSSTSGTTRAGVDDEPPLLWLSEE